MFVLQMGIMLNMLAVVWTNPVTHFKTAMES